MSFKLRISLISPIGTKVDDRTFEFDKELQAKDMLDMVNGLLYLDAKNYATKTARDEK